MPALAGLGLPILSREGGLDLVGGYLTGTPMLAGMATHIMVGLTLHSIDSRMHTHHGDNNKGKI